MNCDMLPFFPGNLLTRSNLGAGMREERPPVDSFWALALQDAMLEHFTETLENFSTDKAAHAFSDPHWRIYPLDETVL